MNKVLFDKVKEAFLSVIPVVGLVFLLSLLRLVSFTPKELITFGICAVLLIVGIALFNLGADMAMTPMGEHMGSGLTKTGNLKLLLSVCLIMGILITIAEPDLSVLAGQVSAVINSTKLIVFVGAGVGCFLLIAILKIVFRKSLATILMLFYMVLFALCAILIANGGNLFVPLAFDSGGVTTGPITVPFIMALGVGIASTIGGNDANENSFGLIALCSVGPMLAVILLALGAGGTPEYELPDYALHIGGSEILKTIGETALDVVKALALIVAFFFILDRLILKLPKNRVRQILVGIAYTFAGLVVFLAAVSVGFMPIGYALGERLACAAKPLVVVFGFVVGAVVVLAEPAVHVLKRQVEEITGGTVTALSMLIALSIGVGVSIGLSVIRILAGFSILYYLVPGYFVSLALSLFVPRIYTAIAFDSGGVASGPLTSSFVLPFAIGVCTTICGADKVMDMAFGIVAMVAMTPLITIQLLGFRAIASRAVRERIVMKRILDADDEQIIYFDRR